jgi:hypothetical protein
MFAASQKPLQVSGAASLRAAETYTVTEAYRFGRSVSKINVMRVRQINFEVAAVLGDE